MRVKLAEAPRARVFAYLLLLEFALGCSDHTNSSSTQKRQPVNVATADGAHNTPSVNPVPTADSAETRSNRLSSARFVGTQACVECHSDQCQSVAHTAHGQALRDVDPADEPPDGEFEDEATGRRYRIYRQGNELRQREFLRLKDGQELILSDFAMRYLIGSGHLSHAYLAESGEYLVESPVTWYKATERWGLSPGYESNNTGFGRPITHECLHCHAGRVEAVNGSRTHLKVHSQKIDCERCHGPGSTHVAERRTSDWKGDGPDPTIVNPGRLTRDKNESVCAQCHFSSAAVVNRKGRKLRDFEPGMSLRDFQIHYLLSGTETTLAVAGHVEQLRGSKCYVNSSTLTCITCHSPHSKLLAKDAVAHYRNACIGCHDAGSCKIEMSSRLVQTADDSCVFCHMPKRPIDIPHQAATYHRIGIHHPETKDSLPNTGTLTPLDDISELSNAEKDRYLGLAYLDLSMKDGRPTTSDAYRHRAQQLLETVLPQFPDDQELLVSLAQTFQRRNPQRSLELARRGLQSGKTSPDLRVRGLHLIADAYLAMRETDKAIPIFEQLVEMRRQAADWSSLSACRLRAGELKGALQAATQAVQIRPDLPNLHALLAEIYKQSHQPALADQEMRFEQALKDAVQNAKHQGK